MNDLELSYLGGFFDAEGCITTHSQPNRIYVYISCTNTDRHPLDRLKELFGGNIQRKEEHYKRPIFVWYLTSKPLIKTFLETMLPFLQIKQQRCMLALALADQPYTWKEISSRDKDFQIIVKTQLSKMNQEGETI